MLAHCPRPCANHVFAEQYSIVTEIIRTGKTAVDLGAWEDESSTFAEGDYFFHHIFHDFHNSVDLPRSQPSEARLWYWGYCTTAFAEIYPASPFVSVVTGLAVAEICTPAKRSYPEKDDAPTSTGASPLCEVDGVRET